MKLSIFNLRLAVLVVGLILITDLKSTVCAQSSFSDLDIEYNELKVAFDNATLENKQLKKTLIEAQIRLLEIKDNLASVNAEAEVFRRQSSELRLRIEALGIESAGGKTEKVEQRLLGAISNLRAASLENTKFFQGLIRLSDAALLYAQNTAGSSPDSRLALEVEIRSAKNLINNRTSSSSKVSFSEHTVLNGTAISVKEDLSLVVVNLGHSQGVEVGMPFEVTRSGKTIATVQIVDVRERVSGAIIQNLSSVKEKIIVGDHLKISAQE